MNKESARLDLIQAADHLRATHGLALGAVEQELGRFQDSARLTRTEIQSSGNLEMTQAVARARTRVLGAHLHVERTIENLASAGINVATAVEVGEFSVNARQAGLPAPLRIPLFVPLFGARSIIVRGSEARASSLIRNLQLEALVRTTPGKCQISSYDPGLSNPLAPFAALGQVSPELVATIQDSKNLDDLISDLTATVTRVGDLLQGKAAGLVEFHEAGQGTTERFRLVTFHDYPNDVSAQQHSRLLTLAKVSPRHGMVLVFQLSNSSPSPDWFDLEELQALGENFTLTESRTTWSQLPNLNASLPTLSAESIVATVSSVVSAADQASVVGLDMILTDEEWGTSSANGLTVPLGVANGRKVTVTFGDDMPHGLITGSSGSGKSNLIKLLIHSLGIRYSPGELELFLLDMKEGVTLAPLAPSQESESFLPHARILGLQADQEFGLSVLLEVERTYKRRMAEMSPFDNIKAYRAANPAAHMPRILIIVDEFQLLLSDGGDRVGRAASEKLLSLVKLVRAAGIHLVLATQEIGSIATLAGTRDGLMAQIKLRIALQNTPRSSEQTLDVGNTAAARLRLKGEMIINRELGALDANEVVRSPFADEPVLAALRTRWYLNRPDDTPAPIVFDGVLAPDVASDLNTLDRTGLRVPRGLLGRPVAATHLPAAFRFETTPGKNLAVVGYSEADGLTDHPDQPAHLALGPVSSIALSLAAQHPAGQARFIVLDLLSDHDRNSGHVIEWIDTLRRLGHDVTVLTGDSVKQWILNTAETLPSRNADSRSTYVFGLGFERVGPIEEREGPGTTAPIKHLQNIWQHGPTTRLHCIFWWASSASFLSHVDRKPLTYFTGVLVLFGAEEVAQRVDGLTTKWAGAANRGLFRESTGATGAQKIIPYRPPLASELLQMTGTDLG